MNQWDNFFDEKIKEIAKEKEILDVGGGKKFQKSLNKYKDLFKDSNYRVLDNVNEYEPDILGDVCDIPIADNQIDAVICKAVLEHVQDPFKGISEIFRILKPQGKLMGYVPFLYSFHAEKGKYGDYWRYTEQGLRYLLRDFSLLEIRSVRGTFETIVYLLPSKVLRKTLSPLARVIDKILGTKNQPSGYYFYAIK